MKNERAKFRKDIKRKSEVGGQRSAVGIQLMQSGNRDIGTLKQWNNQSKHAIGRLSRNLRLIII